MAYNINKYNGDVLVVLEDGTIDTSTSIGLVGRNYVGYGETHNENFVYLLENFANENPPSRPLTGQIWFNTLNKLAYVYNGTAWGVLGAAVVTSTAPESPNLGTLWVDSEVNQLKIWTGSAWSFVGPESAPGFGVTRARSSVLTDSLGNDKPVIFLEIDDEIIAICVNEAFTIDPESSIVGFESNLIRGINLSSTVAIKGNITGSAGSAGRLTNARNINNVGFDGQSNITIKASTTNRLLKGDYIAGSNFDGSTETTWSVDATPSNIIGKVVARNSEGGFSAGTITATFVGNLTGNVTATSGTSRFNTIEANTFIGATLTGNAYTASRLATARKINGTTFDGTSDITVTAAAGTLTGNTLNSTVTLSSLTSLGTLTSLNVADAGANIGSSGQLRLLVDSSTPTIRSNTGTLNFDIGNTGPDISFVNASTALSLGGPSAPAIIGDNTTNLGITGHAFNKVYASEFKGNADTATTATTATNVTGGGPGALLYQTGISTTGTLGLGSDGYVLRARPSGPSWEPLGGLEALIKGTYLNFINTATSGTEAGFNGSTGVTVSVDATSANTASKVVARDSSGNFSATMITAGVTLLANPTAAMHATPKQYVDAIALPAGMINLWYGSIASIPLGWALCNGQNGTPDLRDRFILGAGGSYSVGSTGGTKDTVLPSHTHGASFSGNAMSNHSHGISDPGHFHDVNAPSGGVLRIPGAQTAAMGGIGDQGLNAATRYYSDYQGVKMISVESTNISINGASAGTPSGSVSISSTGSSATDTNLPPYYVLAYIMKL